MTILAFISRFLVEVRIRIELEVRTQFFYWRIFLFCYSWFRFAVENDPLYTTKCVDRTSSFRVIFRTFAHISTSVHMHRMSQGVATRVSWKTCSSTCGNVSERLLTLLVWPSISFSCLTSHLRSKYRVGNRIESVNKNNIPLVGQNFSCPEQLRHRLDRETTEVFDIASWSKTIFEQTPKQEDFFLGTWNIFARYSVTCDETWKSEWKQVPKKKRTSDACIIFAGTDATKPRRPSTNCSSSRTIPILERTWIDVEPRAQFDQA